MPYNFIYAYGAPPDGMDELSDFDDFVKLLITHEFTHVVHLDTILSWCPRFVDSVLGQDLRAQPGAADLVHRGPGGADGVAPDDGGPPAQQLLRHAPAGPVPGGTAAGPGRGLGRVRSARLPAAAASPTSTVPACFATSRIATAPRRSARSRTATRTNASPAASTAPRGPRSARPYTERVRRRHLERLEALRVAQVRAADRGGRAARAHQRAPPDLRRAVAARDAAAADLLSRRDADLPAREQRPGARLRAPRSRHRRARGADGGVRRRAGRRRRRTDAGWCSSALNFIPLGWRISGSAAHQLDRHLPLRPASGVGARR